MTRALGASPTNGNGRVFWLADTNTATPSHCQVKVQLP